MLSMTKFIKQNPDISPQFSPVLHSLEAQIQCFIREVFMDQSCRETIKDAVFRDLQLVIAKVFSNKNAKYTVFGSMVTKLAIVNLSDLDVSIEIDGGLYDKFRMIQMCHGEMIRDTTFSKVSCVKAVVPLLRAIHNQTGMAIDMSFSGSSERAVQVAQHIVDILDWHPRLFETFAVIKFWAKSQGISSGDSYISSCAWQLLFISYLQSLKDSQGAPLVPPLHQVLHSSCARKPVLQLSYDHMDLLQGFFEFYSTTVLREKIMRPYHGSSISRTMIYQHSKDDRVKIVEHPLTLKYIACPRSSMPFIIERLARAAQLCREQRRHMINAFTFLNDLFKR